jgi:hypothetical protein
VENGFDPLLVSEGQVTLGLKAISAAQGEGGGLTERRLPPTWPGGLTIQERSTIENRQLHQLRPRPRPPHEVLSRKALSELQSRLSMMGTSALQDFYRSPRFVCRIGPGTPEREGDPGAGHRLEAAQEMAVVWLGEAFRTYRRDHPKAYVVRTTLIAKTPWHASAFRRAFQHRCHSIRTQSDSSEPIHTHLDKRCHRSAGRFRSSHWTTSVSLAVLVKVVEPDVELAVTVRL